MNFELMDMFDLAELGNLTLFKEKYDKEKLNGKTKSGFGLLHNAVIGHKWDIAEFLINEGIDVNLKNSDGNTALHYLCNEGSKTHTEVMKLIQMVLDRGASVNELNKEHSTPLIKASAKSNGPGFERFKLLLNYNPDIYVQNKAGMSCFILAEQTKDFFGDPADYNLLKEKGLIK